MSTPDPTREAKVPSLRDAAEKHDEAYRKLMVAVGEELRYCGIDLKRVPNPSDDSLRANGEGHLVDMRDAYLALDGESIRRSALAADAEERKEIVAVLRDVGTEWLRDRPIVACRQCDGEGRKIATIIHEPDCRLAALLAKLEGKVAT